MRRFLWVTLGAIGVAGALAGSALADSPQNTSLPKISGKQMTGQTLTTDTGSWSNNPTSYTYQWQRCARDGTECGDIANQTAKTYRLTDSDVGNTVRAIVTARNQDGSTSAKSSPSDVISGNAAPRMIQKPAVAGKPDVGETLTADPGRWAEGPSFTYQWQLCDKDGANCKDIAGATGLTYGVRSSDKGGTIRVQVTAKNLVDSAKGTSDQTPLIGGGGAPPVGVGGALSITAVSLPDRLVISQVQFSPRVITSRSEPLTARFKVTEAQAGRPVSGAMVYAIGVPANRVTNAGERTTDTTGWATMTFQPMKGLPLKRGAQLVFFVRARKSGENPLAGVSTRRLVAVRVSPAG